MKIVSWNVNGLNACIRKRGFDQLIDLLPDVICLQETKVKKEVEVISGYNHYFVCSPRNSYSGCLIMTLDEPQNILYGMGNEKFDEEARVIVAEYPDFFIVNSYFPNTVDKIERGLFRLEWTEHYRKYVKSLMERKAVILCGDFNVTLSELDYNNANERRFRMEEEGFISDERLAMEEIVALGFIDAFREKYPNRGQVFSHWSAKDGGREGSSGGARLDYFFVSRKLIRQVNDVIYHPGIMGSDHCPVELVMEGGVMVG